MSALVKVSSHANFVANFFLKQIRLDRTFCKESNHLHTDLTDFTYTLPRTKSIISTVFWGRGLLNSIFSLLEENLKNFLSYQKLQLINS